MEVHSRDSSEGGGPGQTSLGFSFLTHHMGVTQGPSSSNSLNFWELWKALGSSR